MRLHEIMTSRVVTVEVDDPLRIVKEIFDAMRFHHLLVIGDAGSLVGVLSDRDLLKALSPHVGTVSETARDVASLNKRVHQIMSRKPITLPADAGVEDAIDMLLGHRISCIPVVDEALRPLGIVSWRDVLKSLRS